MHTGKGAIGSSLESFAEVGEPQPPAVVGEENVACLDIVVDDGPRARVQVVER
jgi:hypothetical protein